MTMRRATYAVMAEPDLSEDLSRFALGSAAHGLTRAPGRPIKPASHTSEAQRRGTP